LHSFFRLFYIPYLFEQGQRERLAAGTTDSISLC